MEMDKYDLYRSFYNMNDRSMKIRTHSDALKDTIYRGVFRKDLESEGYTRRQIKHAIRQGWVEERQISIDGSRQNVIIWLDQEMTSPTFYKRWISKIVKYFKGLHKSYRN